MRAPNTHGESVPHCRPRSKEGRLIKFGSAKRDCESAGVGPCTVNSRGRPGGDPFGQVAWPASPDDVIEKAACEKASSLVELKPAKPHVVRSDVFMPPGVNDKPDALSER